MKHLKKYFLLCFLWFTGATLFAQETLTTLISNPEIKKISEQTIKTEKKHTKASYELPFIDDFARLNGYPDSEKWLDNHVFINNSYPIEPVSVGVATFDPLNNEGDLYPEAGIVPFGADTLTSNQINLNYPGDTTIYLSFFIQPGGLGDVTEPDDKLFVDFYSPDSAKWYPAWNASYNNVDSSLTEYYYYNSSTKITKNSEKTPFKSFTPVILPVTEDQYLKSTFQFRFHNRASLANTTGTPRVAGNSDQWHIDFVRLDSARTKTDTIIDDLCFIKPLGSLLNNYESIPWSHFSRANAFEMDDSITIQYANRSDKIRNTGNREFEIEDLLGGTGTYTFTGGTGDNIDPFTSETYKAKTNYIFPYNPLKDSASFEIRSYLVTDTFTIRKQYRWNDTLRYLQKFYNYYAYDDGTAENGYDLSGDGTENAMVAMQFKTYKKDTLRGIQIYFNRALDNVNDKYFKLVVWNEINNKPGSIIYIKENIKPVFEDSLNKFTSYVFDTTIVLENNFYIGWQKIYSTSLNVGFDLNKNSKHKLFKNYAGNWEQSVIDGTVMIRPMFGEKIVITGIDNPENNNKIDFSVYPNPARNYLNIDLSWENAGETILSIFDINGRQYIENRFSNSEIDISGLPAGIYFIRLTTSIGQIGTKKFIVIR
ncbi:MAG: T9SS type A sorting domain-containing protein [Bacteroidales bacterium]|nr:T9SS type A sorting domain-containing protein [Bacteroidales bacterium]